VDSPALAPFVGVLELSCRAVDALRDAFLTFALEGPAVGDAESELVGFAT
jgi:hypothetical protein